MTKKSAALAAHLFAAMRRRMGERRLPDSDIEKAELVASTRLPWQARAARDRGRQIAIICPRRTGKSWYVLSLGMERCLLRPGSHWVVIGLTRPTVRNNYWGILKALNQKLELGIRFHGTNLTATFPNGSVIAFTGGENRAEIEKLRGGQYDGVIIDECKSYNPVVFGELVHEVVTPALGDRAGQLILIGTPGSILQGPFYEATCTPPIELETPLGKRWTNRKFGDPDDDVPAMWSKHTATLQENTAVVNPEGMTLWDEALAKKMLNGWSDDNPVWRREYLGEWVPAADRLVYHGYSTYRHDYDGTLPEGHEWHRVLGFDVGYRNHDAVVILAYAPTHPDVWELHSEKRDKQTIGVMAKWLLELMAAFEPETIVADFGALATKVMETLAVEYGIVAEPAEKKEKLDFIELMNSDFTSTPPRIHVVAGSPWAREMMEHRWDEGTLGTAKPKEDERTANDCCDAGLYAFRYCYHKRWEPKKIRHAVGTQSWWNEYRAAERARAEKTARERADQAAGGDRNLDGDWWTPDHDSHSSTWN